jgi:5-methylcytosine-specific restriction endonuclease McrA
MNEKISNELNKNFHKIRIMEDKIKELKYKSYDIIKLCTDNLNKEETTKIINYLYWNVSELSSKKLAEEVFNMKTFELLRLIKPIVSDISCIECNKLLIVKSRSQLQYYRPQKKRQHYYTCEDCFKEGTEKRSAKRQEQYNKQENYVQYLKHLPYSIYLESEHWKNLRKRMLRRANYRCQVCNTGKILNVHHRTYKNIGEEDYEDLIVLCETCHTLYHNSQKENINV